jgi:hypothetical protein
MRFRLVMIGILFLTGTAIAQETKPNTQAAATTAELAAAVRVTPCIGAGADPITLRECEKRDTARLFLLLGKPDAALRILCDTRTAIEVFRPGGALGSDKFEDNVAANKRCLQSVGLELPR